MVDVWPLSCCVPRARRRLRISFWVFWIRNIMRNVMIVVAVLMTSCHVSE